MQGAEIGITNITGEDSFLSGAVVLGFILLCWFMIQFISHKLDSRNKAK